MENYGKIFREFRKDRGVSMEKLGEGLISQTTLSDFETGKSAIPLHIFYELLKRMNVTLQEFQHCVNEYEPTNFFKTLNLAKDCFDERDHQVVKGLLLREKTNSLNTKSHYDRFNYLQLKAIISLAHVDEKLTFKEKKEIQDYLFSIEKWTYNDLALYSNTMSSFNPEQIIMLSQEMIKRADYYNKIRENKKLVAQILLNSTNELLEHSKIEDAAFFNNQADSLLTEENVYEKAICVFNKGVIDYARGRRDIGREKMEEAIKVFELARCYKIAQKFQDSYEKAVEIFEKS